jgi:AraC-like DNA-binding protein
MQATLEQAAHLSPWEQALAMDIAAVLAEAAIPSALARPLDADRYPHRLRQAALSLIERSYKDPELTPLRITTALGCSRAALYRAFAATGESPAALIWAVRLARAQAMLASAAHAGLSIGEIAFRCGFTDPPTFNRMFKRHYAMTPREARWSAQRAMSA